MYAQLCKRLSEEAPNFEPDESACTFRLLLLNKCKVEFDNRAAAVEYHSTRPGHHDEDQERRQLAKRKMLGNIKFIGELGKLEILSEGILHRCIQELLVARRGDDPSEDLECLCQIMRTCGRILDSVKGRLLMEQYFDRMKVLAENNDLQPRIRFMLKDVIDLRNDGWVPRKATVVEGPMPINQIRPAEDDRSNFRRDRHNNHNNHHDNHHRDNDRSSSNSMQDQLFRHPMKTRGGLDDMLMSLNSSSSQNLFGANGYGNNNQREGGFRGHNNQRSGGGGGGGGGGGYGNYNSQSQRGQYKHNQNNQNSQYNNQSNKEIAPRFKKSLILAKDGLEEVELRPNSMLFNKASVRSNNVMNSRPMESSAFQTQTVKSPSTPLHKEPLPIKQVSAEKPKQSKKDKGPTKDEVLKKYASLLDEYWRGDADLKQAVNSYKEHKVPDKFAKEVLLSGFVLALDKSDAETEKLVRLLSNLKEENAIVANTLQEAFKSLCNVLEERENELEDATKCVSVILSSSVAEHLITLAEVAALTDNGTHHPLFLLVLQQLHQKRGKAELSELFNKSKVNLLTQLPECDKTKERMSEILEERDLTFLYPLLRIHADLARQLGADPNPQSYYKWIKENLDPGSFTDPGFINALMTVLLKYITQEAAAAAVDGDDKAVGEKEKSMLERYQPILTAFLREKLALQLVALYSVHVHFYSLGFPKGQLLRWFMALYDLEIVDEEAFLNWKEDVTDAYPGKGQALFQVHQWLMWLQEASSEEEEGED